MADAITGGCRCGAVRYTLAMDTLPRTYTCHCLHCQTWTGTAFSQQAVVPEAALTVTGDVAIYEKQTQDRLSRQRVCPVCFTRIFNTNTGRPGMAVVRAGTLDRSNELACVAHIWVKRKQPWLKLPGDVPTWPEGAPLAELLQALAPLKAAR